MQDLCVSASTKAAKAQAQAKWVPRVFSSLFALQAMLKCRHSVRKCSAAQWEAEQRAQPHLAKVAQRGLTEECPIPCKAQLPGLQGTWELHHHRAENKAQAEGFEEPAGWRELVQP